MAFVRHPITARRVPAAKRLFDLLVAALGFIIALPVMLVTGLALLIAQGWPVFFVQERPGRGGKLFKLYKFRSMLSAFDRKGNPLPDEQRLSKIGKFVRSTSLDELPELFNVLRGEMSLVGPRPLFAHYLEHYSASQMRRHEVLPGITGWAQVNGRNALSWEEKFKLDVWYVDHWSFWLDLKILFLTVWKVIKREGISQAGQATAAEFKGKPARHKGKTVN